MSYYTDENLNKIALAYYRKTHPRSRRQGSTAFSSNGSIVAEKTCLCGSSVSWCNQWPKTVTAIDWEIKHANCIQDFIPLGLA